MQVSDFEEIVDSAGLTPPTDSDIEFTHDEQIWPSSLRLAAGTSTALAMVASAIDDIWAQKTGKRQNIKINMAHAALTISGMWLLRVNGIPATEALQTGDGDPTFGEYECADGINIYLQNGFMHLAEATAAVLGSSLDPESVRKAARKWTANELEAALTAKGLPGLILRTPDEWLQHPQGKILADTSVVDIEQIGEAPIVPLPAGLRPLSNLRVIDSTRVLAGPTISRTLAEFGADVIHVGSPNISSMAAAQADTGHGKRKAHVDLETEVGIESLKSLISQADVFAQSYRAGSLAARGFGPSHLAQQRPGIIYVSENAYGQDGPWREKRGFDGNVQAATGITHLQNIGTQTSATPRSERQVAMAMNDYCTGYWGAFGVLEALKMRAQIGGSWHVKVSLGQTASWYLRMGAALDPARGLTAEKIIELTSQYVEEHESDYGVLQRLRPVINMSETTPHWVGRTVLPGRHAPNW
jgi:crotonobetainyl-CoA:carnitine CoA-transferase CaiB-like acyl-CoA transferase